MVETRLRLAAVELEEEKANLIQLLVMAGLTLLLTAFGLMSLLILIFWAIDPLYRPMALGLPLACCCSWLSLALSGRWSRFGALRYWETRVNNWPSTTPSWKGSHEPPPQPET